MSAGVIPDRAVHGRWPAALLLAGVVLATFTDAVAGTLLVLGRNAILGDTASTPDEFAWLDVGYTTAKLVGYAVAPWILGRLASVTVIAGAVLALTVSGLAAAAAPDLAGLLAFRVAQGLAGGVLLVSAQSLIFWSFPRAGQPLLQAMFAAGAVVAPGTLALLFQGWIVDLASWRWVLLGLAPLGLAAAGLLVLGQAPQPVVARSARFDGPGVILFSVAILGLAYALTQGNRWDGLESWRIQLAVFVAAAAFAALVLRQRAIPRRALFRLAAFRNEHFQFAFVISFVAGVALFGSAFLLPAFTTGVLGFSPLATGALLAPGAAVFLAALFLSAFMIQRFRMPGLVFAPLGILLIMIAMALLSRAAPESGTADMAWPLVIRGLGLGFLFLALTLMAFMSLPDAEMAYGIAMFNIARQVGGLAGVAGLQAVIEHQTAAATAVFNAGLPASGTLVTERLAATAAGLSARGMDAASAAGAARGILARSVGQQAAAVAFDTAFMMLALLFVVSVPLFIVVKVGLARLSGRRAAPAPGKAAS